MRNWNWPSRANLIVGLIILLVVIAFSYYEHLAPWLVRLSLCALFCSVIYLREQSRTDRWLTIGIIATGTLLSVLLMK